MNLKKSFVSAVAGLALIGSIAAPIASAQYAGDNTSDNTTTAKVYVDTSGGSFNVYFAVGDLDFGTVPLGSQASAPTVTGNMALGYTDSKASRPSFDVKISATNFQSTDAATWTPIPASGFKITSVDNVVQTNCTCGGATRYGDIGQYVNEGYVSQGGSWPKAWTANNTLDQQRKLQFGYTGVGTYYSYGYFGVALTIPATTAQGHYTSTLTIDVVVGTQP